MAPDSLSRLDLQESRHVPVERPLYPGHAIVSSTLGLAAPVSCL